MDLNKAENILGLKGTYTIDDVKKSFRLLALRYHPDKNNSKEANIKFQEVYEAYEFLTNYDWIKIEKEYSEDSEEANIKKYNNIFDIFIKSLMSNGGSRIDPVLLNNLLHLIATGCKKLSKKMFEMFDRPTVLRMFSYALQLKDILQLTKEEIIEMEFCLKSKDNDYEIYLLNPSLENLLLDHIYILKHQETELYIPLWHSELIYDISGQTIIVRCVPEIPENIWIDENNNLHIKIIESFEKIKKDGSVNVSKYTYQTDSIIPIYNLYIREEQEYVLKNRGVLEIDTDKIFNTKKRADIIFHIKITDLF